MSIKYYNFLKFLRLNYWRRRIQVDTLEESSTEFAKPTLNGGRYENPKSFNNWGGVPGLPSILKWQFTEVNNENVPDEQKLAETIPITTLSKFVPRNNESKLYASWLGHATVLVSMNDVKFITDPIWAERASIFSFTGPKRYRPPPMKIEDLPTLDFALISHDHYDHLDKEAVLTINKQNPSIRWFVPLGMLKWMASIGIKNSSPDKEDKVTQMNWGDTVHFQSGGKNCQIWCIPAQHWGQRGPFDRNWRLWAGWAVEIEDKKFFYSGDTGYCDKEYEKVGKKLGPFDLAAIPIGAYEPRWFMKSQHINPEEAVNIHEMIKSKMSLGIHWGTYHMGSYEFYLEPQQKIKDLMALKTDAYPFVTIGMGTVWEEDVPSSTTSRSN